MSRWTQVGLATVVLLVSSVMPAKAQTFLSAGVGGGGGGLISHRGLAWQGQFGGWVNDRVGIEADYGYHAKVLGGGFADNIRTITGGVLIGQKLNADWRAYGTVGVGLIGAVGQFKDNLATDEARSNDGGIAIGGGVMGFFSHRWGVRVDVRYFRELTSLAPSVPNYFTRFGAGLALRF